MLILAPFCNRVIRVAVFVAAVRIGVLWYLLIRQAMGQQSLDDALLILPLYPEGLLLPRNWEWTLTRGIGMSIALSGGSLLITAIIAAILRVAGDLWRSKSKEP